MTKRCRRIAIIGAGFTGTALALELLRQSMRQSTGAMQIMLIDRSGRFGHGLAYGTTDTDHLLNVCAARMSLFDDDPQDFVAWLARFSGWSSSEAGRVQQAFLPRATYGTYIEASLRAAMAAAPAHLALTLVAGEAVSLRSMADGACLTLSDGRALTVDRAVLCLGNFAPALLPWGKGSAPVAARIIQDPWAPQALEPIAPQQRIVVIGTGLTMIDVVLSLTGRGHRGGITALSRHGLLPQPHLAVPSEPYALRLPELLPRTAQAQLRWLRAEIARAAQAGIDWRSVMDAVRLDASAFWRALPPHEKQRFLRHLRSYWDVHRHRMAPPVAARIAALIAAGQLVIAAARVTAVEPREGRLGLTLQPRGPEATRSIAADWIINGTGPACRYDTIAHDLVQDLLRDGEARLDPLGLGFEVGASGQLVSAAGRTSNALYALGLPTRGTFWEVTAVPDLRRHAAALAGHLAREAAARNGGEARLDGLMHMLG